MRVLSLALLFFLPAVASAKQVRDDSSWFSGNNPAINCNVDVGYVGDTMTLTVTNASGWSNSTVATPHSSSSANSPAARSSGVAVTPDGTAYKAINGRMFYRVRGKWWPVGTWGRGGQCNWGGNQQTIVLGRGEIAPWSGILVSPGGSRSVPLQEGDPAPWPGTLLAPAEEVTSLPT